MAGDQQVPDTLAASLVGALNSLPNIGRDREASIPGKDGKPGYSYRYVDLASMIEHVKPTLAAHGLALIQEVSGDGRTITVSTVLLHRSGEERRTPDLSMPARNTPQATGSAITYARRYQAMAVLGIAPDDDDGQAAASAPYVPLEARTDLTPPLWRPADVDGYTRLAHQRGLADDEIAAIVRTVTGNRTSDLRYLFQTESEALTEETRRVLAARTDAEKPGSGAGSPGEPRTPAQGTDTAPNGSQGRTAPQDADEQWREEARG